MDIKKILESQKGLEIIKRTNKEIFTKAKRGPSKITKIPFFLSPGLSFFFFFFIWDGHLRKDKLQISIEMSNRKILEEIIKICNKEFNRKFNICKVKRRKNKKQTFNVIIDSKSILLFLNEVFEIPRGKKSNLVGVPREILLSDNKNKIYFEIQKFFGYYCRIKKRAYY